MLRSGNTKEPTTMSVIASAITVRPTIALDSSSTGFIPKMEPIRKEERKEEKRNIRGLNVA